LRVRRRGGIPRRCPRPLLTEPRNFLACTRLTTRRTPPPTDQDDDPDAAAMPISIALYQSSGPSIAASQQPEPARLGRGEPISQGSPAGDGGVLFIASVTAATDRGKVSTG